MATYCIFLTHNIGWINVKVKIVPFKTGFLFYPFTHPRNSIAQKNRKYPLARKSAKRFFLPKINKFTDLEKVLSEVKFIDLKIWNEKLCKQSIRGKYYEKKENLNKTCKTKLTSTRHEGNMNAIF